MRYDEGHCSKPKGVKLRCRDTLTTPMIPIDLFTRAAMFVQSMTASKNISRVLMAALWLLTSLGAWSEYASAHSAPVMDVVAHHDDHHDDDIGQHHAIEHLVNMVEDAGLYRPTLASPSGDADDHVVAESPLITLISLRQLSVLAPPVPPDIHRPSGVLRDLATVRLLV